VGSLGSQQSESSGWLSIADCEKRWLDLGSIYPDSRNLFLWLLDMGTLEVESLIRKATTIDRSWDLDDIVDVFTSISRALRNTTPTKARIWVKSLRKACVFPVRKSREDNLYSELLAPEDDSWFIADRPYFNGGFQGVVPLLAFSVSEIKSMSDLFISLSLDSRKLSKLSHSTIFPSGTIKHSPRDTLFFRSRVVFIKV
jgi:hypothetical protein